MDTSTRMTLVPGYSGAAVSLASQNLRHRILADTLTGMLAVQAVLTGLLQRRRSGVGPRLEINVMQAQAKRQHLSRQFTVTGEEYAEETSRVSRPSFSAKMDTKRCTS